jgi:hypothetical protein
MLLSQQHEITDIKREDTTLVGYRTQKLRLVVCI